MIGCFGPPLQHALGIVIAQMDGKVAPSNPLFPVMLLLRQLAEDVDDYTTDCLRQADAIRQLVRATAAMMPAETAVRLEQAVAWQPVAPQDFHATSLARWLSGLRCALIDAHAWLESADIAGRDELLNEIWSFLEARVAHESRQVGQMW